MKRKGIMIGTLAAGLTLTSILGAPGLAKVVNSAQKFQHYFRAMENTGGSLGTVERLIYSLVLANSAAVPADTHISVPQNHS